MEQHMRGNTFTTLCCKICSQRMSVAKRCSRCKQSFYWKCQIKDWAQHKLECCHKDNSNGANDGKVEVDDVCRNHPLPSDIKPCANVDPTDYQQQSKEAGKVSEEESLSERISGEIVSITVMSNKTKHKLSVNVSTQGNILWEEIAGKIRVPADVLKLIHKGQMISKDNILEVVRERAVFQAIGVEALSEEGLNSENISYIMRQMNVDRNCAVAALRLKGEVVDAILYLGNK